MLLMKCQNRAGPNRPPARWWQKAQSGAAREKTLGGARAQVPVYRQQRPEDSKIGTQSARGGSKAAGCYSERSRRWRTTPILLQIPTTSRPHPYTRLHATLMSKRSGDCSWRVSRQTGATTVPLYGRLFMPCARAFMTMIWMIRRTAWPASGSLLTPGQTQTPPAGPVIQHFTGRLKPQ